MRIPQSIVALILVTAIIFGGSAPISLAAPADDYPLQLETGYWRWSIYVNVDNPTYQQMDFNIRLEIYDKSGDLYYELDDAGNAGPGDCYSNCYMGFGYTQVYEFTYVMYIYDDFGNLLASPSTGILV